MSADDPKERANLDACLSSIAANLTAVGERLEAYAREIQDAKSHMWEARRDMDHIDKVAIQAERVDGVPQPGEFADALAGLATRLDVETRQLLAVHMRSSGRLLGIEELARLVRQDVERARKRYASFGRSLGALLEFAPRLKVQPKEERPLGAFCQPHQDPKSSEIRWQIRDSAVAGFEKHIRS